MPLSHYVGYNLWILKATFLNRGRGIHVFKDLNSLKSLIYEYCKGVEKTCGGGSTQKTGKSSKIKQTLEETAEFDPRMEIEEEAADLEEETDEYDPENPGKPNYLPQMMRIHLIPKRVQTNQNQRHNLQGKNTF